MQTQTAAHIAARGIGPGQLFAAFAEVAAHSFGGAAAWARIVLVQRRRWLTEAEFTELLGLGQVLPGPNVVNVAAIVGDRACGPLGAIASVAGLLGLPTAFAILLDVLLMRAAHIGPIAGALSGLGAGAAGLVWAMGLELGRGLGKQRWPLLLAIAAFAGSAVLRLPLLAIVLVLGPIGVALAWREGA